MGLQAGQRPPPLQVQRWFNTASPITLDDLLGRVVAVHTFQMLCPGCVAHGTPQAQRLRRVFPERDLALIALHTVFEHHEVMGPAALEVFLREYRIDFPVGIDAPGDGVALPKTMAAWQLQGTPTLVLLDRAGRVALHHFGQIDDMALGAVVGQLCAASESRHAPPHAD